MSPERGRPKIDNPLKYDVKVRLDDDINKRLMQYCDKYHVTKAEAIRKAIVNLLETEK